MTNVSRALAFFISCELDEECVKMNTMTFAIDAEFQALIPPLSDDEFSQLEQNVIEEGCRDALVVWLEEGLLLDGHNRYNICMAEGLPFDVVTISLPDRQAATNWLIDNQLGRRNLSLTQASVLRGKRYNAEKVDHGGDRKSSDHFDHLISNGNGRTVDRLASEWGVSRATVQRDGKLAENYDKHSPDVQRDIMAGEYTKQDIIAAGGDDEVLQAKKPHVANNSGNNEWYTPSVYIDAALKVMGEINLDPATSETANEVVGAERIYTADDDGRNKQWGGNVWMNPPYSSDLIGDFTAKLRDEFDAGSVTQAIALVNNATETYWFQYMAESASAICFPRSRVKFWKPNGETGAPLQGQAILYFGSNADSFAEAFDNIGMVLYAG